MFTTKPPAPRLIRDLQESSTKTVVPIFTGPRQCNVSNLLPTFWPKPVWVLCTMQQKKQILFAHST